MPDYVAYFKLNGSSQPHKALFAAENVPGSIRAMSKAANVSSTIEIAEFEILQIIGKDKYVSVACKNPSEKKLGQRQLAKEPLLLPAPATTLEAEYEAYQCELA